MIVVLVGLIWIKGTSHTKCCDIIEKVGMSLFLLLLSEKFVQVSLRFVFIRSFLCLPVVLMTERFIFFMDVSMILTQMIHLLCQSKF